MGNIFERGINMKMDYEKSSEETANRNTDKAGGFVPLNQIVSPVGPQMTVPFTSVESTGQQAGNEEHLQLFGQNQFHDNLGPVYAIPTYPSHQGNVQSSQTGYGHMPANQPPQYGYNPVQGHHQWQQPGSQPQSYMPCCKCGRVFTPYF